MISGKKEHSESEVTKTLFYIRSIKTSYARDPWLTSVIVLAVFYVIVFSIYSIMKMYSLSASGWDLGLDSQIMFSTLHGKLFYSNLLGFSILQEHFSPFIFVILGEYALYPSPLTLLVLQAFFVSFATIPLYLFGRRLLELRARGPSRVQKSLPFLVVMTYYFSPLTQGLIFFDFHIMSFLPFFFFLSFYAYVNGKRLLNIISLIFIVSLHSNFVFIAAMVILSEYILSRVYFRHNLNSDRAMGNLPGSKNGRWHMAIILFSFLILLGYLILAGFLKSVVSGTTALDITLQTGEVGGYSSITGLIYGIVTNPGGVMSLLTNNSTQKLVMFYYGFGSGGFLSLLSPVTLLTSIPYFLYAFLSTNTAYYALGYQYPAMFLPSIFISSMIAVAIMPDFVKNLSIPKYKELSGKISVSVLFIFLVGGLVISASVDPISTQPLYRPIDAFSTYHAPNIGESTSAVLYLSEHINKSAYLLTQNNLFPFFSLFLNAYSTPWSPGVNNTTASNFEYIIGDYASPWVSSYNGKEPSIFSLIQKDLENHTYGVYLESGSILAIKKGYTQKPVYQTLFRYDYTPRTLHIDNGHILSNGTLEATNVSNAFVWNGPYVTLYPGHYNLSFHIGLKNFSQDNFLQLEMTDFSGSNIIFNDNISGISVNSTAPYFFTVSTPINVVSPIYSVEFRGYGNFTGTVFLKNITVMQSQ